jgi:hypothetical protein
MRKTLYFVLGLPFFIVGNVLSFFVWEILSSGWKERSVVRRVYTNRDQSDVIQHLNKKLVDQIKRADDLHDYYGRQLKKKDLEINRSRRRK